MSAKTALFMGRFQPPSIAHWCTVETIRKEWSRVVIAIVYDVPQPKEWDTRFSTLREIADSVSYRPGKNPFDAREVEAMWRSCIESQGLSDSVDCAVIPRPEFDPDGFNAMFPPGEFELVRTVLTEGDAHIDAIRGKVFPELFRRHISYVRPRFKLHNTEIRESIARGEKSWTDVIAPGALGTFERIGGPQRVLEAHSQLLQAAV